MRPDPLLKECDRAELGIREDQGAEMDEQKPNLSLMKRVIVKDGYIFILLTPEERLALYLRRKQLGIEAEEVLAQWLRNVLNLDYPPNQILNGSHLIAYYRKAYEKLLQRQDFLLYILQNVANQDPTVADIISPKHRLILNVLRHLKERKHKSTLNSYQILLTNLYSYYCAIAKQQQIDPASPPEFWGICNNLLNEKLDWGGQPMPTGPVGMNGLQSLLNRIGKTGENE